MSEQVGNPEDLFSHNEAHMSGVCFSAILVSGFPLYNRSMVSMRLLVIGAYLLQLPCHANSGHAFSGHAITGHAKSLRAQLIDAGIIKLKHTRIIFPKKPSDDQAKAKFFKQFDENEDYHFEGLGKKTF